MSTPTANSRPSLPGLLWPGGILDQIVEAKAIRVGEVKAGISPFDGVSTRGADFIRAISRPRQVNVIAEIKQKSPSKGVIRKDFDPTSIARGYSRGGAVALSILTEEDFFGGSLDDLKAVRQALPEMPLLRKDFLFDEVQLHESAAAGASAILLITAILNDELLGRLIGVAARLGLSALVEVHDRHELERALAVGALVIGVNNRDLKTFTVDLATSSDLAPLAGDGVILISESGIHDGADLRQLGAAGFHAFLVGEHLMRAPDPGEALSALISAAGPWQPGQLSR